jgi:hypothetical protein
LICDGIFPLAAAKRPDLGPDLGLLWQHWFAGDIPEKFYRLIRDLGVVGGRDWPACHGTNQGLLGWFLAEDQKQFCGA